jgi:hypothetical protein
LAHKLIVVDSAHPLVRENRCFDSAHEFTGCGHAINVRLAQEAKKRSIDIITADIYLAMPKQVNRVVCLTDMITPFTDRLLSKGVQPAICLSLESPLNAKTFYHRIVHYAGRFHHSFQFRGTQERLFDTDTIFHPIVFPIESRMQLPQQPWDKRNYLILVNSNKRSVYRNFNNFREIIYSILSQARSWHLRTIDPWMRIREIYADRIKAIRHFSGHSDFSLYGMGWNRPIQGFSYDYHKAALKVYKGSIPSDVQSKRKVMNGFKFALCFENCVFPGYVTEKIFDCFLAGSIPVYFGAPDITDFIPRETFVDFRRFTNYLELDRFLRAMSVREGQTYIEAARDFLGTSEFNKFTVDYFVNEILNIIEDEFEKF